MKYRIKQIAENKFVPQVKQNPLFKWASIRVFEYVDYEPSLRYGTDNEDKCTVDTYEKALEHINTYNAFLKKKAKYPIIHNL
jgi:hypothetical protein